MMYHAGIIMTGITKRIFKWLETTKFLRLPRRIIWRAIARAIFKRNGVINYYNDSDRAKILDLIKEMNLTSIEFNDRNETETLSYNDAYQIFTAVKKTSKIKGDIAEVGVYKGSSAKVICEAKGDKSLHLFDTFNGLPELSEMDNPRQFGGGGFIASLENVKNYLKKYPNVYFYKGIFPFTTEPVKDKIFSFVNLDVDLYKPTLDSLKFFYPKMSRCGIIISHDYIGAPGVKRAFDEFFKDKPEPIIEISSSQCLIVKL